MVVVTITNTNNNERKSSSNSNSGNITTKMLFVVPLFFETTSTATKQKGGGSSNKVNVVHNNNINCSEVMLDYNETVRNRKVGGAAVMVKGLQVVESGCGTHTTLFSDTDLPPPQTQQQQQIMLQPPLLLATHCRNGSPTIQDSVRILSGTCYCTITVDSGSTPIPSLFGIMKTFFIWNLPATGTPP